MVAAAVPVFDRKRRRSKDVDSLETWAGSRVVKGVRVEVRDGQGNLLHTHETGDYERAQRLGAELKDKQLSEPGSMRRWTIETNVVSMSPTMERGTVGISAELSDRNRVRPGDRAVVSHGRRMKLMRVKASTLLSGAEIELCGEDMDELGVSESSRGSVQVKSEDAFASSPSEVERRRRSSRDGDGTGHKVRVATGKVMRTDNETPAYVVDSGLRFWKRRRQE